MRRICYIIVLLIAVISAQSQDVVVFKNGSSVDCQILSVDSAFISYKKINQGLSDSMKIPLSDIETFTYHQAVSSNNVGQSAVVSNTNTSGAIPVPNYEITSYDVRCINDAGKELKKYSRHFYTGIILYSTGASVLIIGAVVFTPLAITAGTVAMFAGVILALESPIHVNKAGNLLLLFQPKIAKK